MDVAEEQVQERANLTGGDAATGENGNVDPNDNNNQLGEFLHSTATIDRKKRPSVIGNAAFLFAVLDVALAGTCTWYWYNWIWILAVPAFVGGLVALTCTDNPKMSFLWAACSFVLSAFCIAWSVALLIICHKMCTCQDFSEKRTIFAQMAYRMQNEKETKDLVPCVYVKFPPRPVPRKEAENMKHCFSNPLDVAVYGYGNGYKARECQPPPKKICREFDWFQERRKQEEDRDGKWAWIGGPNIFQGQKIVKEFDGCHLDSDCQFFPQNLCFGEDVDSSVCVNGSGVDLGGSCHFDRQCQKGRKTDPSCPITGENCPAIAIETLCLNYVCVARANCPSEIYPEARYSSPESKGADACPEACSCCDGGCGRGQCIKGGGGWECQCLPGYFGPNCMYGTYSEGMPSADEVKKTKHYKGICHYVWPLCSTYNGKIWIANGDCEPSEHNPSGFECKCHAGFSGQYCHSFEATFVG